MIFMFKLWFKLNILSSGLAKAFFTNHLLSDIEHTFSSKWVVFYILEGLVLGRATEMVRKKDLPFGEILKPRKHDHLPMRIALYRCATIAS